MFNACLFPCSQGIKNDLDPRYDANKTAGYRDVVVYLRVSSAAAAVFGCSTHICELQLVHSEVSSLMDQGRLDRLRRYKHIMFRFFAVDDGRETAAHAWSLVQVCLLACCITAGLEDVR